MAGSLAQVDLVERCAIGEVRLVGLGPAAEGIVDREQRELRELRRVLGLGLVGGRAVVVAARDVLAFECHRQSLALNRRALNEAGFSNSFLQSCRQWEVGEAEIGEMMALCGGVDIGPRYLQIRFSAVKNTVRPPKYPLYSCELRGKHLPQIVPDPPGGVTSA